MICLHWSLPQVCASTTFSHRKTMVCNKTNASKVLNEENVDYGEFGVDLEHHEIRSIGHYKTGLSWNQKIHLDLESKSYLSNDLPVHQVILSCQHFLNKTMMRTRLTLDKVSSPIRKMAWLHLSSPMEQVLLCLKEDHFTWKLKISETTLNWRQKSNLEKKCTCSIGDLIISQAKYMKINRNVLDSSILVIFTHKRVKCTLEYIILLKFTCQDIHF